MRQKDDDTYKTTLANLRVGTVSDADTNILKTRVINLNFHNPSERLYKLYDYVKALSDAVCIMPTNDMCDTLNEAMLARNNESEIELLANDKIDAKNPQQRQYAKKKLEKNEDSSVTAGLPKKITIKKNAKVMIRRNIDTSLGLVNGTLCVVDSITRSVTGEVEKVNVRLLSGEIHGIDRIKVTFEISTGVYVNREQFPLILSNAITVHKSQGINLKTVVILTQGRTIL